MAVNAAYDCAIVFVILCMGASNTEGGTFPLCGDPPTDIDLKEMATHHWWVLTLVEHNTLKEPPKFLGKSRSGLKVCPTVHFTRKAEREMEMYWQEHDGDLRFHFQIANSNRPGEWMSKGKEEGTLLENDQFSGAVQVMQVEKTHCVLTFCCPDEKHYSIVLSRKQYLHAEKMKQIKSLFHDDMKLNVTDVDVYCWNADCEGCLTLAHLPTVLLAMAMSLNNWITPN